MHIRNPILVQSCDRGSPKSCTCTHGSIHVPVCIFAILQFSSTALRARKIVFATAIFLSGFCISITGWVSGCGVLFGTYGIKYLSGLSLTTSLPRPLPHAQQRGVCAISFEAVSAYICLNCIECLSAFQILDKTNFVYRVQVWSTNWRDQQKVVEVIAQGGAIGMRWFE